eukprot:GEMP01022936.1.p1 GENE.GEMP01022936.1~~GEMP01022936.1.p1  ORF type:complete len:382 (+),score=66.82 GEMP01022936.1:92-1147(+)
MMAWLGTQRESRRLRFYVACGVKGSIDPIRTVTNKLRSLGELVKVERTSGVKNSADFRLACWFGQLIHDKNDIAILSADEAFVELEHIGKQHNVPVQLVRGAALADQLESSGSLKPSTLGILQEAKDILANDDVAALTEFLRCHAEPIPLRSLHTGRSLLMFAVQFGSFRCLRQLVAASNVNHRCATGMTALMWSARVDVQRILVAHHADVNARDDSGNSVLHCLSRRSSQRPKEQRLGSQYPMGTGARRHLQCGLMDSAAFLVAHGADLTAKNADGLTAMDAAPEGDLGVKRVLLDARRLRRVDSCERWGHALQDPMYKSYFVLTDSTRQFVPGKNSHVAPWIEALMPDH